MATTYSHTIRALATFSPAGTSRAWHTAAHPDQPIIATASSDKTARIYSLTNFRLHSTVSGGHKRSIRSVAWKPNQSGESVLATASFDASVGIWRRWQAPGDDQGIQTIQAGDDTDADDEDEDWRFSVLLDGHENEVKDVAFNSGGQFLATCSRDKSVWIWEEIEDDNFETVAVLQEHEADIKCVVWHPDQNLLASGSYDDSIRLYREDLDDWTCIALLAGHTSTVWSLAFEPLHNKSWLTNLFIDQLTKQEKDLLDQRAKTGSRLMSCSDDTTIRLWQKRAKELPDSVPAAQPHMPSIFRTTDIDEDWYEQARLPQMHSRAIYSIAWSPLSGRVASTGSDGKIVVYQEQFITHSAEVQPDIESEHPPNPHQTEWVVIAQLDGGHGVYEINHICWTRRRDRDRRSDDEELIITTGDDGEVKAWTIETA